jgi:predicted Zn finger-like uncharacterized protein
VAGILYDEQTEKKATYRPIGDDRGLSRVAIYIFCPSCKGSFKVRDEYAGKQGVCPKCGHVIRIASSTSETQRGVPRPATKAQKEEAQRLGIDFDDRMTYVDLKKKIEAAKAAKHSDDRPS